MTPSLPELQQLLADAGYVASSRLETTLFLALRMEKPLLLEGPAGSGKTEVGKVLAQGLEADLVRLQCYEGLDEARALYEWNYQKQLLRIQVDRDANLGWQDVSQHVFTREFLLERPLLRALTSPRPTVLLIDEVDKADEEFEAFLLEILGEFQVTIPELGTIEARQRPIVVLTSNRTRDLSDALKRRCLYFFLDFPDATTEAEILRRRVPELDPELRQQAARFVHALRSLDLRKAPSVAETIDWARSLLALGIRELRDPALQTTLGLLLKHDEDHRTVATRLASLANQITKPREAGPGR